ncbi:unnamed protein product [Miscanthus lutarioriparius]|uniref:Uncharacterized protein n=1 Tax=Miscanthus lutarioriparius TaxID=422564 RepID=A0A811SER6_9POAL|nr:unnamed protein product [Miscanthus lutarioriparius]
MAVVCTSSSGRVRHMAEAGPEPWPRELRWLVVSPGCGSPATPVLVSPNGARNFSRPSPVLLSLRAAPGLPSLRYAEEIGSQNGIGPVMMMVFEKGFPLFRLFLFPPFPIININSSRIFAGRCLQARSTADAQSNPAESCQNTAATTNGPTVRWDEPSAILRPDRVSPWELEPLDATNRQPPQPPLQNKHARSPASPSIALELSPVFGFWKFQAEPAQAFSFSGPQRTQELYHSNPNSIFSSSLNVGFNSKNERSTPNNNHLYWTMRETITRSYYASINKDPTEKKQEYATSGCRLFGLDIDSAVSPMGPIRSGLIDRSTITVKDLVGDSDGGESREGADNEALQTRRGKEWGDVVGCRLSRRSTRQQACLYVFLPDAAAQRRED